MGSKYTVGVDFGTESARALLVEVATGTEVAQASMDYPSGVIDTALPNTGLVLAPDWALQDPDDYLTTMYATVADTVRSSGVDPGDVIGVGIDFTSCTILPVHANGDPLTRDQNLAKDPHAWVKLWKHHAAQPQADLINRIAQEEGVAFLDRFGGRISSEWLWPKLLQIAVESPGVYDAADRVLEAEDWVVWQLTGEEARSLAAAGYKAIFLPDAGGYPDPAFLAKLNPRLATAVQDKLAGPLHRPGERVGGLQEPVAGRMGLLPGTPVATANMDAVASVAAAGVVDISQMVMVMGTSVCDIVLGDHLRQVEGMCGTVRDVVVPGLWAYESGQACVGDIFNWFRKTSVPAPYSKVAELHGTTTFDYLEQLATQVRPGAGGLLALEWWNGNRSVLVDANLTGLIVGFTLATKPEEIYRALLESTAFGKRVIIEAFETAGIPINRLVACGGLPRKSPLLMQIYADITGRPIEVLRSTQVPALGAALQAAVAAGHDAGGWSSVHDAASVMASPKAAVYTPRRSISKVYDELFEDYVALHEYFGRGHNTVMSRLKSLRLHSRND